MVGRRSWTGAMGIGRRPTAVLLPRLLLALASAVAVAAVPLAEGPATEETRPEGLGGCVYGGSEYSEGEAVVTDEHCLNCTCSRGALICHLRACPPVPRAPGCKAVRKDSHACCPSIVCDYSNGSEKGSVEESILSMNRTASGCYEDGELYEEGSYVSGKAGPCENCFCTQGTVKCKLTPCPPAPIGCTALFGHESECCPSRYDCSTAPSLTLPPSQHGGDIESELFPTTTEVFKSTNEVEEHRASSGSSYDQVTQIPTSTVSAIGDGRKNRLMDKSTTEGSLEDETPTPSPKEEGGDGSTAAQEETADALETTEEDSSATITEPTTTETEEGALTSSATTELSIENTKTEVIDETTTEGMTTPAGESGLLGEGESTDGTTTEETTITTVTSEGDSTTVTTEDLSYTESTITTEVPEETTTDITTTELPSGKETTEEATEAQEEGTMTAEPEVDDIKISTTSSPSVAEGEKEDLSQKSSHLVDIGAQGIDCEVQVNQSAGNEKGESSTLSSEKAADQSAPEGEAELFKEGKMNSTEGAMVETTPSSVESSITTMLSIDRKKDVDYGDYDYNEPTLPPSLPNLRIIPFVAADAVVDKEDHKTTENSIFFDGAAPSLFSPPVETEGGFVPREPPLLHDVTYQVPVLSDVLPIHGDLGLAGIAAIDITTTSKPSIQGNFGVQDNDVNETLASGILDAHHIAEKPLYPYITDKRPSIKDTMPPSLLPIPLNFSLQKNSTTTSATSAPGGSVTSIKSTISGFTAPEISKPSDRVSEIPYGPTPPRPSPSTSPSYSTGPHITPEKTPSPSALSMGTSKPQSSPAVGLLKLAGCNIYGRMYRVGRIISELSGPCLECRCTEVGVQCRPLPC